MTPLMSECSMNKIPRSLDTAASYHVIRGSRDGIELHLRSGLLNLSISHPGPGRSALCGRHCLVHCERFSSKPGLSPPGSGSNHYHHQPPVVQTEKISADITKCPLEI